MTFVVNDQQQDDLSRRLVEWVSTPDWARSRQYLTEHAEVLVSQEGRAALEGLVADNPEQQVFAFHLMILDEAIEKGVDAAYQALEASVRRHGIAERIVNWVATESWEDDQTYFAHHSESLMTDEAEEVIGLLIAEHPDQPDLLAHQGLLSLCRIDGPDKAYDLLVDPERLRRLVDSPAAVDDPGRALPRARLLAGLFPEEAEPSLQHAILALRTGLLQEAGAAIGRCQAVSAPADRERLLGRIDELMQSEPDLAPGLYALRTLLDQPQ